MIQNIVYALGIISLVLVVLFALVLARVVSLPLVRLTREVEQVGQGNLDQRVDVDSYNEIGILSQAFNQMMERIRHLVSEAEEEQRRKRKLELKMLQLQITPHFLYNSLENLSALSLIGDNETAYQMSEALAIFYREVLSDGKDILSIREEVDIARNYLLVQSIRYRDKFTFDIQIDPAIEGYPVVKLTLQPLVENAIYHGIRQVRTPGRIVISGAMEEGVIVLRVQDNGKGMPQGRPILERRPGSEQEHGDLIMHRKGFGMSNVVERLKMYFGAGYGLSVRSAPGQGTCVEVRLPPIADWEVKQ